MHVKPAPVVPVNEKGWGWGAMRVCSGEEGGGGGGVRREGGYVVRKGGAMRVCSGGGGGEVVRGYVVVNSEQ